MCTVGTQHVCVYGWMLWVWVWVWVVRKRAPPPPPGCILPAVGYRSGPPPPVSYLPDRHYLSSPSLYGCMYIEVRTVQYTTAFRFCNLSALGTGPHSKGPVIHFQAHQPPDHGRSLPVESYCPHRQLINPQDRAGGFHQTPPPHLPYHFIQVLLGLQPYGRFVRSISSFILRFVCWACSTSARFTSLDRRKVFCHRTYTTAWTGELGWPGKVITGVRLGLVCRLLL